MASTTPPYDSQFMRLARSAQDEREWLEFSVLVPIASAPEAGVEVARGLGLSAASFSRHDLRCIWVACEGAGRYGRDVVERVTLGLLCGERLVSPGGEGLNGRWSEAAIARFFRAFSADPSPAVQRITLEIEAPRLAAACAAQRDAGEHVRHAVRLLERIVA